MCREQVTQITYGGAMTSGFRMLKRAGLGGAGLVAAGALASALYQEAAAARDRRRFPPPGRLIDVGGRRLHLLDAGAGTPAVVVLSALADSALCWVPVQRKLAAEMRVCLYDRAGAGWSDPPPRGPRTARGMAGDLRALLDAAGIAPPYVLVAHSVGGVVARQFAARYPGAVAGMVLVDSSHEAQAHRRPRGRWEYLRHILQYRVRILGVRRARAALGLLRGVEAEVAEDVLPEHAAAYRATLLSSRFRRTVIGELRMMARSAQSPPELGSLPLTVITAGAQLTPQWRQMQEELAALSSDSTHLTAEGSGHYVFCDDPELVIQAVRDLVRKVAPA
jgi:pimeloyl-ACP methyl ester carboxylesterase